MQQQKPSILLSYFSQTPMKLDVQTQQLNKKNVNQKNGILQFQKVKQEYQFEPVIKVTNFDQYFKPTLIAYKKNKLYKNYLIQENEKEFTLQDLIQQTQKTRYIQKQKDEQKNNKLNITKRSYTKELIKNQNRNSLDNSQRKSQKNKKRNKSVQNQSVQIQRQNQKKQNGSRIQSQHTTQQLGVATEGISSVQDHLSIKSNPDKSLKSILKNSRRNDKIYKRHSFSVRKSQQKLTRQDLLCIDKKDINIKDLTEYLISQKRPIGVRSIKSDYQSDRTHQGMKSMQAREFKYRKEKTKFLIENIKKQLITPEEKLYMQQVDKLIKENIVRQTEKQKQKEQQRILELQLKSSQKQKQESYAAYINQLNIEKLKIASQKIKEIVHYTWGQNQSKMKQMSVSPQKWKQNRNSDSKIHEQYNIQKYLNQFNQFSLFPNAQKLVEQKKRINLQKQKEQSLEKGKQPQMSEQQLQEFTQKTIQRAKEKKLQKKKQKLKQQQLQQLMKTKLQNLEDTRKYFLNKNKKKHFSPTEEQINKAFQPEPEIEVKNIEQKIDQALINQKKLDFLQEQKNRKIHKIQIPKQQKIDTKNKSVQDNQKNTKKIKDMTEQDKLQKQQQLDQRKQFIKEQQKKQNEKKQKLQNQKKLEEQQKQEQLIQKLNQQKQEQKQKQQLLKTQQEIKKKQEIETKLQRQRELESKKEELKKKYLEQKNQQLEIQNKIQQIKKQSELQIPIQKNQVKINTKKQILKNKNVNKKNSKKQSKQQQKKIQQLPPADDIGSIEPNFLLEQLQSEEFRLKLQNEGYDVQQLQLALEQQLNNQNQKNKEFGDIDLDNMSSQELFQRLENPQFRLYLENQGIDVNDLQQQVNDDLQYNNNLEFNIDDMHPQELKIRLQDEDFCKMLMEQQIDANQLKQQLQDMEMPLDLENMDPLELQEKLKDPEFQEMLQVQGYDIDEIIQNVENKVNEIKKEQIRINQEQQKIPKQQKAKQFQESLLKNGLQNDQQILKQQQIPDNKLLNLLKLNPKQLNEIKTSDLQTLLKQRLTKIQFLDLKHDDIVVKYLKQKNINIDQIVDQMYPELEKNSFPIKKVSEPKLQSEKNEIKKIQDDFPQIKNKFINDFDFDDPDLQDFQQNQINLEENFIDIENMDPKQLKDKLSQPEFRNILEKQGYDVQDLDEQLQKSQEEVEFLDSDDKKSQNKNQKQNQSPQLQIPENYSKKNEQKLESSNKQSIAEEIIDDEYDQVFEHFTGEDIVDILPKSQEKSNKKNQINSPGESQKSNQKQDIDIDNMDPEDLKNQLQNQQFRQKLQRNGIDVIDLERKTDEILEMQQIDLQNMDPVELKQKIQDPRFRQILESQGIDLEDLENQLNEQPGYMDQELDEEIDIENMDAKELKIKLSDPKFKQKLEDQGIDTVQLEQQIEEEIKELENEQQQHKKDPLSFNKNDVDIELNEEIDLEHMDPTEIKQKLQNPQFIKKLESMGVNIEELENQIDEELLYMDQPMQPENLQEQIQNMDPILLQQKLQDEQFRKLLEQQGIDTQELIQQVNQAVDGGLDIENMTAEQLQELLADEESQKMLEEQGYDLEQLQQLLMQKIQEKPDGQLIDIESMDPEELKVNLQNEDFRNMLHSQGYDVESIVNQVLGGGENDPYAEGDQMIDINNMDPQELAMNLQNPEFVQMLESYGYDVEDLMNQVFGNQEDQENYMDDEEIQEDII